MQGLMRESSTDYETQAAILDARSSRKSSRCRLSNHEIAIRARPRSVEAPTCDGMSAAVQKCTSSGFFFGTRVLSAVLEARLLA